MNIVLTDRIEEWRSQLLDTSKRNRLIRLNLGKTGAIGLAYPDAETLWNSIVENEMTMTFPLRRELTGDPFADGKGDNLPTLFDGESSENSSDTRINLNACIQSPLLRDYHILTELSDKLLQSRLARLALNARASMTEQGVPTLYLTFGMLKWFESPDSDVEILSPLILFPVEMNRENIESPWDLSLQEADPVPNYSLAQLMSSSFAIRFPDMPEWNDEDSQDWRIQYFSEIRNSIRHLPKWEVWDECTLGIFGFQKIAMWQDLGKNQQLIIEHDLCRAVAGDKTVRLPVHQGLPKAQQLDTESRPSLTYHILDSDSSQHEAIEAAKRGASLVLDGPPGTGKSQTIANIIAEFLAMNKTVLFVSEKSAALDVVKSRLDKRGLGDFCLECHSHKANKKQVIDELGRCLDLPRETYPDRSSDLDRLFETRAALNEYVQELHAVRLPLGLSAFQGHGLLAEIKTEEVTRCVVSDTSQMTPDRLRQIEELLDSVPDCENAIKNQTSHPWRGIRAFGGSLNVRSDVEDHFGRLDRGLQQIATVARQLSELGFGSADPTVKAWLDMVELLKEVPSCPLVPLKWFHHRPRNIATGFLHLDAATREYRLKRAAIPEFYEEKVLRLRSDSIESMKTFNDDEQPSLLPHNHTTVLTYQSYLQNAVSRIKDLAELAQEMNRKLTCSFETLGVKLRPIAAPGMSKVQELLCLASRVAPLRRTWLDVDIRAKLQDLLNRLKAILPEFDENGVTMLVTDSKELRIVADSIVFDSEVKLQAPSTIRAFGNHLRLVSEFLTDRIKIHADTSAAISNILGATGLTHRSVPNSMIPKISSMFEHVVNAGSIQRLWLDHEIRPRILKNLDDLRSNFPECSAIAVLKLASDPRSLQNLENLREEYTSFLKEQGATSVRSLKEKLQSDVQLLERLKKQQTTVNKAVDDLTGILGQVRQSASLKDLCSVPDLLRIMGRYIPFNRSWLDTQKRREIGKVVDQCSEHLSLNTEVRIKLLDRMVPKAFDRESALVTRKSLEFRSIWRRLFPSWRRMLGELTSFYAGTIPATPLLFDDLRELDGYHRRLDLIKQMTKEYSSHLLVDSDEQPDWDRTKDALNFSDRFAPLLRVFPDAKEILIGQNRIETNSFTNCVDILDSSLRELVKVGKVATAQLDLGAAFDSAGDLSQITNDEFGQLIDRRISQVVDFVVPLDRLCLLLRPDKDIAINALSDRVKAIRDCCYRISVTPIDDPVLDDSGEMDLDGTIAAIRDCERFDQLVQAFPEMKAILADTSRVDRDLLISNLAIHNESCRRLDELVKKSDTHASIQKGFESDEEKRDHSIEEFRIRMDQKLAEVNQRLLQVDRICSWLKPDLDLERNDLTIRFKRLNELSIECANPRLGDFLRGKVDGTDWNKIWNGLRDAERLDPLVIAFPELREILSFGSQIDWTAFRTLADGLADQYHAFRNALPAADEFIAVSSVLKGEGNQQKLSVTGFVEWLGTERHCLETCLSKISSVADLLKPGHDFPVVELNQRLCTIDELQQVNSKIETTSVALKMSEEAAAVVRDMDWSKIRLTAEWVVNFLDIHADNPPETLVRAVTHSERREELNEVIKANLAARTDDFLRSWNYLIQLFDPDEEVSCGIQIAQLSVTTLNSWIVNRKNDADLIEEWTNFCELRSQLTEAGLSLILSELANGTLSIKEAKNAFLKRFYRTWLDEVYEKSLTLRRFKAVDHERRIESFRDLDRKAIHLSAARIRESRLNDPARPTTSSLDAPSSSELGTLLKEINKKKRHLPLRQLFLEIPDLLLRLKPCLMMSPLAVSTYLETKEIRFDVVIFDEASQVRPYDAISSIYRARQLIVAGDQKQLPPTSFFERSATEEEVSTDVEDFEESLSDFDSILDVCCTLGLPRRRLRWHYRSKREQLIAFSNRHYYENELVTFPSVNDTDQERAIRFEFLSDGRWKTGTSGGFNALEALKTAKLVMAHFRNNPELSLGVISFSQRQQMAILDELERMRRSDSSLEKFFSEEQPEPFFVKNLENVQGDERDVVFLSIGYGPDENGKLAMRFGPLNNQGGERRLNVAITRARMEMKLVTSIRSHDIDLSRTGSEGVRLLRAYLDYAERGVEALGADVTQVNQLSYDSRFEQEVATALKQRGLVVRTQVGCSGYRIDLALVDPKNPGRFVLGIECDGATYHNSATARDRDRLRQEVLESLGWEIIRIWSTDWVRDPATQIDRAIAAFELSLAQSADSPTKPRRGKPMQSVSDMPTAKIVSNASITPVKPGVTYEKIEDVPTEVIKDLIVTMLEQFGSTNEDDLLIAVARKLNFQRTGVKIKAQITRSVTELLRRGKIVRADNGNLRSPHRIA